MTTRFDDESWLTELTPEERLEYEMDGANIAYIMKHWGEAYVSDLYVHGFAPYGAPEVFRHSFPPGHPRRGEQRRKRP